MNVLFVKLGAIGDAAMALHMLPALQATYPGTRLTWLCGRGIEPLLSLYPEIAERVVVDERVLFGSSKIAAIRELISVQRRLLGRRFDLVIHGNADLRYRLLTATVLAKATRGFSRTGPRPCPVPGRYHGDEYARLATGEDGPEARSWPVPSIAAPLASRFEAMLKGAGRLVVLVPGGAKNLLADDHRRRWPVEAYVAVARELCARGDRVALTGGDSDRWIRPAFAGLPCIDLLGQTSLPELLGLFAAADVAVSHDTSAIHLARLVRTPVVALFGPTVPSEKVPNDGRTIVLWGGEHLACRPCYDGRNYGACRENTCLRSVPAVSVLEGIDRAFALKSSIA